jgi:hypothetical protein
MRTSARAQRLSDTKFVWERERSKYVAAFDRLASKGFHGEHVPAPRA